MRQQALNESRHLPLPGYAQTAPPQAPSCFISCCTEDDGLSCDRGRLSLRSSSFRISHKVRLMREVLTSSIECLCLRQRHTQHLPPLHFAPLHGANLLRRIALFHFTALQVGRSAVLAARPMAHLSISSTSAISPTAHESPSLAALANTRQTDASILQPLTAQCA